jgi:hypothetical protein
MRPSRLKIGGFLALCALCATAATIYVVYATRRAGPASPGIANRTPVAPAQRALKAPTEGEVPHGPPPRSRQTRRDTPASEGPASVRTPAVTRATTSVSPASGRETGRLVFRSTALASTYGLLGVVPLAALDEAPTITTLSCDRVHAAAGAGVCLTANRGVFTTYRAVLFDADFRPRHTLRLSGVPSRVRVSPDGRVAAITVFVSGHSYAAATFSTLTTVLELKSGDLLADDLEKFTILRHGAPIREVDFNLWGVTFARDSRRFYATLRTGGKTFLLEGDLSVRQARVLRENVECPSLSPDNTRLAFKKREGGGLRPVTWRLSVLELRTLEDRPLAETRSVDDQVEWLDDRHVLYSLPEAMEATAATDTWVVPADGSGQPRLFMSKAYSPVVLH